MATVRGVTLIGAGTQGTRLAYMWSRCGRPVYLLDKNEDQLKRASKEIQKLRQAWPLPGEPSPTAWGATTFASTDALKPAILQSWLTIECVPESRSFKKSVIKELDEIAPPNIVLASNSSSYTITDLLEGLSLQAPDRFASVHSYWPPETTPVEIMGTDQTRPEIISLLMKEAAAHGFQPFHVRSSSTGYIYNRIWAAIKREALSVLDEKVATPEEIDAIFKAVLKTPKGPCEQMDTVGLDVVLDIEEHYAEERPGLPEQPRHLLRTMIDKGRLGVKSGHGFFKYP